MSNGIGPKKKIKLYNPSKIYSIVKSDTVITGKAVPVQIKKY